MCVVGPTPPAFFVPSSREELTLLQVAALEAAANPILISTRGGIIVWANQAFEQLSGYTREETLGHDTRLLKSGRQPPSFYENLWRTILSGKRWRGELINRRKDGSFYQEEMVITPVSNGAGEITHFIAIKLDISERKRAQERIRLLAQVVENSADLISIADSEGLISVVNPALLRATGYEESELIGKFLGSTISSPNNPPQFNEEVLAHTLSHSGWTGECLLRRKDGSDFPAFLRTGLIRGCQGQIIGIYGIAQDTT